MKYDFEIKGDIGYGYGSKGWVSMNLEKMKGNPCNVRVNSLGGSVDDALDIVARFQEHGDVTVHLKGMNASAATILAMGAKKIVMDSAGLLLIHNCLNVVWELGWMNANEIKEAMERMKKQAEDQSNIDRVIASIYSNRSGRTWGEIKKVMDRGTWLDAEECLKLGLVDEVVESNANSRKASMAARADFKDLQLAYGFPDLPALTTAQKAQNVVDNINENMNTFFTKVLALFGIEAMASEEATAEQVDAMVSQVEAKHIEMKNALSEAQETNTKLEETNAELQAKIDGFEAEKAQAVEAALAEASASQQEAINAAVEAAKAETDKAVAEAVAAKEAEMQAIIDSQKAQIEALQAGPGADDNQPTGGKSPQTAAEKTPTAAELYDSVKDFI